MARLARFWWLFRRSLVSTYEDNGLSISKGAAYSALLAFFPLLTTLAALLVQIRVREMSRVIAGFLFEVVPPGTEELVLKQFAVRGERPSALLVGAGIVSLWAASGLMVSLMEGFNSVYKVPTNRPVVRQRLVAILLVFCSALPVMGASVLILFGERTETALVQRLGFSAFGDELLGWLLLAGKLLRYAVAIGAMVLFTSLLYKFAPNRPQRWRDTLPGAYIVAVLWLLFTMGFAWYVRNIADYNLLYGGVGAAIALMVWMYLLVLITLTGCAFNSERENLRSSGEELWRD